MGLDEGRRDEGGELEMYMEQSLTCKEEYEAMFVNGR